MKYWLRCAFLCAIYLANSCFAQEENNSGNPTSTYGLRSYADSLFAAGNYYEAAIAFDRAAFFNEIPNEKANLLLKESSSLKQLFDYQGAERTLSQLNIFSLNDSLKFVVSYEASFCAYLSGNFSLAKQHLEDFSSLNNPTAAANASLLYALILNEENKWPEAKKYLEQFINAQSGFNDSTKNRLQADVNALYTLENTPQLKSVRKATILSKLVPGLGQLYAGYFWEGAGAFMFNVGVVGLTAAGIYVHYYVTSILFGGSMIRRFYEGNVTRAEFLTRKSNYNKSKLYNQKLKNSLQGYVK